jgi:hypothetical protein
MRHPRRGPGRASLAVVLLLTGTVLAACDGASSNPPALPPLPGPVPGAAPSDADLCGPKPFGAEQPPNAWVQFDVTPQQLELIHSRLVRVLCRQGLWQQGVGFGFNSNPDRTRYWVVIHPGHSGLTARQILDRLLGRTP